MGQKEEIRLDLALDAIQIGNQKQRADGLKDLKAIFDRTQKAANIGKLTDKAYHKIYEVVFKLALSEKQSYLAAKKNTTTPALARLTSCADVIRVVVKAGAPKLKGKTVEAVIDHITQTLPKADGGYCEPIAQHYLKALSAVFEHTANVERLKTEIWLEVVDFCVQGVNQYLLDTDGEASGLSRSFSGLGTSHFSGSVVKSALGNGRTHVQNGSISRQNAEDLLQTLLSLVSASNAPLEKRYNAVADVAMRFLASQSNTVSQVHQVAFSIVNEVLFFTRVDHTSFSQCIANDAVPIIWRFWQGKNVAKDEMLNSVRGEMLTLLFAVHPHLERSLKDGDSPDLLSKLEELLDVLRADYARRLDRDQIQLDELEMEDLGEKPTQTLPFRLFAFRLKAFNVRAERNWANLLIIGILERLVNIGDEGRKLRTDIEDPEADRHPRKRQRTTQSLDRLLDPLKSADEKLRTAGLQMVPFVLQEYQLSPSALGGLLNELSKCALDKRGNIASWALLAIASCTNQKSAPQTPSDDWMQLWHAGTRSLTFSVTCRAAAIQLHTILAKGLVQYHDIGEDVNAIIATADISGPPILCDSAISLMVHLLHARVTEVPSASLVASQHVIRWLFARWNPSDKFFAAHYAIHVPPRNVMTLIRTSLGLQRVSMPSTSNLPCGSVAQAWQQHLVTQDVIRYLLLLDDPTTTMATVPCPTCPNHADPDNVMSVLDTSHFHSVRRLILELLLPKCSNLLQSWKTDAADRSSAIPTEHFRTAVNACITILLAMTHFVDANLPQLQTIERDLQDLSDELINCLRDSEFRESQGAQTLTEALLQSVQPYLPPYGSNGFTRLSEKGPHLLLFFVKIAEEFDRRRLVLATLPSGTADDDLMDLDDEFTSQQSLVRMEAQRAVLPRQDFALDMATTSFYFVASARLTLLSAMSVTPDLSGFLPSTFVDQLVSMPDEELLSCRRLLKDIFHSDLVLDSGDAARLVERLGAILSSNEFDRCEIALGLCLDVLIGLEPMWSIADGGDLAEFASELYRWFVKTALQKDIASPPAQRGIARLLLSLLRGKEPEYGVSLDLPSPRSSLFQILQKSNASVKFYVGNQLPGIFELFVLKDHDEIFVDILENLPSDPDWTEGIGFRMLVLAKLASRWPTLLRRCIYHIFETPGRIIDSINHASRCMMEISSALKAEGPRELFELFAPQILYTWLEFEQIEDIPFQIFGFHSLKDLITVAQQEAVGLMVMRGQDAAAERVAAIIGVTTEDLLQNSFTKIMAYAIAHDMSVSPPSSEKKRSTGEVRVKKRLGQEAFFECVNLHFVDILALRFSIIDQEENAEKYFAKRTDVLYAADIINQIKSFSTSSISLPPNQQPAFKVKFLAAEIQHLCSRTEFEPKHLYTPALVTSIARKLLNTIHPALGSLHACSVMRKLRILIALAGDSATRGYPLEMLLQSVRPFITDPECADDAIGIAQYLLTRGSDHLLQVPSFVAGVGLPILGSLRTFLQSSRGSSTQESQFKNTMSKAQAFHKWMGEFLLKYSSSPALASQPSTKFHSLVQSAHGIRSVGNADVGTPESELLFRLLEDEQLGGSILSRPARELTLSMLCSEFRSPTSFRTDILGNDDLAIANAAVVWKSARSESASKQYLSWAARVLGRAFTASGHIHQELLQESTLAQIKELSPKLDEEEDGSRACILKLLQALTLGHDRPTVGLAEAALRVIISTSDDALVELFHKSLSEPLHKASSWAPYQIPPSENPDYTSEIESITDPFASDAIFRADWLRDLSVVLTRTVLSDPLLHAMVPILLRVPGFASRAFPFILHAVLSTQSQGQQLVKRQLSASFANWFSSNDTVDKNNLKMLINSILYLRTQSISHEKSSADRSYWLDIDYIKAAAAATRCGMYKTALLFVEESCSGLVKSSRRSSIRDGLEPLELPTELLLTIFKNIDDPDLYYGVQQTSSLSTILARFEYERDGPKSLAFRGAQYDSHVRRGTPEAAQDVQSLVKALDVLSLNGLSHSLLQGQQAVGMSSTSLESMFRTARKLEQWDIPVPSNCSNNSVTLYKAFQAVHNAPDYTSICQAIDEGLECTMGSLIREDLSASALHGCLQTLAALVEMDEVLSTNGSEQFEEMTTRFRARSGWMKIGRFDDINQIISCRGTTLSTLSQQPRLHDIVNISPIDTRLVEVQTALLASALNRAHNALQESLSLATSLMDLIKPCQKLGLNLEVAVHMEAAKALWDQGEMASSIGILQALDDGPSLKKQNIHVGRSDLLSTIGHQVSVARLEKADRIIEKYLNPALKELKGKTNGNEAGQVFHQFAIFCDQQLQDPDGLEDLERLKKLSKMKRDEVAQLDAMMRRATSSTDKTRYKSYHGKAKSWLKLDEEELQRHNSIRDEFLHQSLENYLLALGASDDHDNNALRFSALWLEHSEEQLANEAVSKHLRRVPSRKFAPLMNQLTSRLQDSPNLFQQLLFTLVRRICTDHPYHGMYQIYAAANSRANSKDESAMSRNRAAHSLIKAFNGVERAEQIWQSINATNKGYCILAGEKDDERYKGGQRLKLKESQAGNRLSILISKYRIPPPTMQISLASDLDYSKVPLMVGFEAQMSIASGVSAPKIITAVANNGSKYKQLVKGGNDDLRQDAIMEQVFDQVSELLKTNRATRQRNLSIRTYKVLPLTSSAGVIEFVPNTIPLHDYLMPAHERYYPKDLKGGQCRKEIGAVQSKSIDLRVKTYRSVTERFHPVLRYFFTERFTDPDEWFIKRLAYSRSTAAISILGHVLGLGDRHGHNILLDAKSGEVIHIDLGVAFEMGRVLPVPELVPFRLTRDIVDGMGITKTEGVFRRCCEFTLEALRKEVYSIMTILDVLRYDPLYSWSISPVRLAKLQEGQSDALEPANSETGTVTERTKEGTNVNEPGEADRALTVVNKKLSKTLSVIATVNDLINQASDERNLAVLYSGWAAYV